MRRKGTRFGPLSFRPCTATELGCHPFPRGHGDGLCGYECIRGFRRRSADLGQACRPIVRQLTSAEYTAVFNEVKSLGIVNSTAATADQALIGRFWNGAIQNYWNEITQTAVQAHHLTTAQSARVFALLNLTLADEVIAFYDSKYTYNLWRPVTAIRAAAADGNPDTAADPTWLPQAGKTAADPSYPGAHATISAGAAFVLRSVFGNKPFHLNVTSEVLPGVIRSFDSFAGAKNEASLSRIYAGQHFRSDENAGEKLGSAVADFVVDNFLTHVNRDGEADEGRAD